MLDGAADAADVNGILFDHRHPVTFLGQQIGGRQPRGPGADNGDIGGVVGAGGVGDQRFGHHLSDGLGFVEPEECDASTRAGLRHS